MATAGARRDLAYFLLGPAALTAVCALLWRLRPWPVPMQTQAEVFAWPVLVTLLGLGALGVWLSSRVGFPSAAPVVAGGAWSRVLLPTVLAGAVFGAALLCLDAATNFTSGALKVLGATWVNVPLPWSLPHYAAGAVLLECAYRLAPIPVVMALLRPILNERTSVYLFVTLAGLTSCIEPAGLLGLARPGSSVPLAALMAVALVANLFEAFELKRRGWPAPVAFRLSFYGVWHCFGPYLLAPSSPLYPGPR